MHALLLSNSTQPGYGWLEHERSMIAQFLGPEDLRPWFVPYAGVSVSWDAYFEKARDFFASLNQTLQPLHSVPNPSREISQARGIIVGGGNSFALLKTLQEMDLLAPIRSAVVTGAARYMGWSAGSNLACPGIYTTNDMPICQPQSFSSLGLIDFQINPHYTNQSIAGHGGETRDQRIAEFCVRNPATPVVGLPEGTYIHIAHTEITLGGAHDAPVFVGSTPSAMWVRGEQFTWM